MNSAPVDRAYVDQSSLKWSPKLLREEGEKKPALHTHAEPSAVFSELLGHVSVASHAPPAPASKPALHRQAVAAVLCAGAYESAGHELQPGGRGSTRLAHV